MNNKVRRTSFRWGRIVLAMALASLMLVGGSAAVAGGHSKPQFVSGNSTVSDCGLPGSDLALALTGDLKGCWSMFVEDYTCRQLDDYDLYIEKGREVFIGKFKGRHGTFRTKYTFEGAYAKGFCQSFDPTLEVAGGCIHKVFGATGVFADAKGLVKFLDVITDVTGDPVTGEFQAGTGGNNFPYYGRIDFDHYR